MAEILIIIVMVLAVAVVILEIVAFRRNVTIDLPRIWQAFASVEKSAERLEGSVKEELAKHRDQAATAARQSQEELVKMLKGLEDGLTQHLDQVRTNVNQKLQRVQEESSRQSEEARAAAVTNAKTLRDEVDKTLKGFQDSLATHVGQMGQLQKGQLDLFSGRLDKFTGTTEQKLDGLKTAVEARLKNVQEDNTKQLEQMRATADERLQGAEKRLGESFKQVRDQLERVQKQLAEMPPLPPTPAGLGRS